MASIKHWGMTDGFRVAQTIGKELNDRLSYSTEEFIIAAEAARLKHLNEWVIYYTLADKYSEIGHYADALLAARKCVDIRPKDIRSTYALASCYSVLSRASWSENEELAALVIGHLLDAQDTLDKRYAQAGLDNVGLAVDTSAVQAIRWFETSLQLNPDSFSKDNILTNISGLYKRFPHLRQ